MRRHYVAFALAALTFGVAGVWLVSPHASGAGRPRTVTVSPGMIHVPEIGAFQFEAFNPTTRTIHVVAHLAGSPTFFNNSDQTADVTPGTSATFYFVCGSSNPCSAVPTITASPRAIVNAVYSEQVGSNQSLVHVFPGQLKRI